MDSLDSILSQLYEFIFHLDRHIAYLLKEYGSLTYLILFLVIFCETGLVITPFLPGDSLLFTLGTFTAVHALDFPLLGTLLTLSAILGDTVNYAIGFKIGERAYTSEIRWIRKDYLERTRAFFARHGRKTIILARFIPILRTFAPFVAGVGRMPYGYFLLANVAGGILWVWSILSLGHFFGNLPWVKAHFSQVILGIILLSLVPLLFGFLNPKGEKSGDPPPG